MAFSTTVTITPSYGSSYTWAGAGFAWADPDGAKTWDTVNPVFYALNVGEGWSTGEAVAGQYQLKKIESWRMAESWSQAFNHVISETWQTGEVWADIWQPMLRIFEAWAVAEAMDGIYTLNKSESWHTGELATRVLQLNNDEGWTTGEALLRQYQLARAEGWSTAWLAGRAVARTLPESLNVADGPPVWAAIKAFMEAWSNGETMSHVWQDFLTFVEGWTMSGAPRKGFTKPLPESWRTAEGSSRGAAKGILEAWTTGVVPANRVDFERVFAEAWQLAGALTKEQIKAILEALSVDEAYLRSANAVISDLVFASGDKTASQFLGAISSPAGYGPFSGFIPGELEYQKALIALVLSGPLTTGRPQVTEWKLTVDVPDLTDAGTLRLQAANTFVPFKARFFAPPEVIVQLRGGSTGSPDITAITETGFYVQINDAAGHPIAGDIVWSAVGY